MLTTAIPESTLCCYTIRRKQHERLSQLTGQWLVCKLTADSGVISPFREANLFSFNFRKQIVS